MKPIKDSVMKSNKMVLLGHSSNRNPIVVTALQIIGVIFLVEIAIMLFFAMIELEINLYAEAVLDASLLSIISAPFIYYFIILPFIKARSMAEGETLILSRAVESSSTSVIITDKQGSIEYVNPKFSEITGYTKREALGHTPRLLRSSETEEKIYMDLWQTIESGSQWKGEFRNQRKNGNLYWDRCSVSCVKDITGKVTHYISTHEDVTQEFELTEKLNYQAKHDLLTGLINRFEFERRVDRLLSNINHEKDQHAICFMDLDQFKIINDTCGHIAGDELLHQLGSVLSLAVRQRDTLARLGGDEFGVLMEHCSIEQAQRVADALLVAVQSYQFSWEGQPFRVGISIGLVAISESTPNLTELMKQADAACYMAKDGGRNRIHIYNPEDTDLSQRIGEMLWVNRINHALQEDRFCLYAQAIKNVDNNIVEHYEFLIRMIGEDGEIIRPGSFLPAAERYDLIENIDSWVIENAFTLLAQSPELVDRTEFFSINLSGKSLTSIEILEKITSMLETTGIEGDRICFEITETIAISNLSAATRFIAALKSKGCRFALDDFGSGISSFGYLKTLPVDYLKIDGIFVRDILSDPISHAMVKSISEIGHLMGMKTIAEFVEKSEMEEILQQIQIDYVQGYAIDKPRPFEQLQ